MKWSWVQLQKYRNKNFEMDEIIDLTHLKERDKQIRSISPIRVQGRADIQSERITFHIHITGELILPCARTLLDVRYPLDIHSTEIFHESVMEYDEENLDSEFHLLQGNQIDLTPVIEELILLEIPMQVYSEEAEHLPSSFRSGKGWELIDEEQDVEKIDPRLAKLAQLLKNDNQDNN